MGFRSGFSEAVTFHVRLPKPILNVNKYPTELSAEVDLAYLFLFTAYHHTSWGRGVLSDPLTRRHCTMINPNDGECEWSIY